MLGILSALNWGMAALYVCVIGLFLLFTGAQLPASAMAGTSSTRVAAEACRP